MLGATVGAREQGIFPVERDRADRALDGIVVELDGTIVDDARQAFPTRERIADSLGKLSSRGVESNLAFNMNAWRRSLASTSWANFELFTPPTGRDQYS
jgi:hypothetical protein